MDPDTVFGGERFDIVYLVLSGTSTAARCPELLRELVGLGFSTVIALPTPNATRTRRYRRRAGRPIVFRSLDPPAAAARGGAFRPLQLQLAQQARTRHRR